MLDQPQLDGAVYRDLPLDPALERQHQSPDQPPFSCFTAFSPDRLAWGSWAARLSRTTWGVTAPFAFASASATP
eukprot:12388611-Alexandrium_andersonii.AAC.1